MSKLVEQIRKFREDCSDNSLCVAVADYYLNYSNKDSEIIDHLEDILKFGSYDGNVADLVSFDDSVMFYVKHRDEINDLLGIVLTDNHLRSVDQLITNYYMSDPLALYMHNREALAHWAFEQISADIMDCIDEYLTGKCSAIRELEDRIARGF